MAGWSRHEGLAVGLPLANIDTDQLIPARFMSTPRSEGYGRFLLHDLRQSSGFALDDPGAQGASVLIARRNFGGGSSREAAVYALLDAGFRVVIAPSFGDIFASNAVNNGLCPARVTETEAEALLAAAPCRLTVDLAGLTIAGAVGGEVGFALDPVWQQKLVNGWDDIDLTARHSEAIARYAASRRAQQPWLWPGAPG